MTRACITLTWLAANADLVPFLRTSGCHPTFAAHVFPFTALPEPGRPAARLQFAPFCKEAARLRSAKERSEHFRHCEECQRRYMDTPFRVPAQVSVQKLSDGTSQWATSSPVQPWVRSRSRDRSASQTYDPSLAFQQFTLPFSASPELVFDKTDFTNSLVLARVPGRERLWKFARCLRPVGTSSVSVQFEDEAGSHKVELKHVLTFFREQSEVPTNRIYFPARQNEKNAIKGYLVQVYRRDLVLSGMRVAEWILPRADPKEDDDVCVREALL